MTTRDRNVNRWPHMCVFFPSVTNRDFSASWDNEKQTPEYRCTIRTLALLKVAVLYKPNFRNVLRMRTLADLKFNIFCGQYIPPPWIIRVSACTQLHWKSQFLQCLRSHFLCLFLYQFFCRICSCNSKIRQFSISDVRKNPQVGRFQSG